jgi:L-asparaginase
VQAAVDHGAKGLVIEALGLGDVNQPMFAAIKEAIGKGIPVVVTSRVPNCRVLANMGLTAAARRWWRRGRLWATTCGHRRLAFC